MAHPTTRARAVEALTPATPGRPSPSSASRRSSPRPMSSRCSRRKAAAGRRSSTPPGSPSGPSSGSGSAPIARVGRREAALRLDGHPGSAARRLRHRSLLQGPGPAAGISPEAVDAPTRPPGAPRGAEDWLWCGRRVKLVNGSTAIMADTPANQQAYPQLTSRSAGWAFRSPGSWWSSAWRPGRCWRPPSASTRGSKPGKTPCFAASGTSWSRGTWSWATVIMDRILISYC